MFTLLLNARIPSVFNLPRPCACHHHLCEFSVDQSCCVRTLFTWSHPYTLALKIFPPPLLSCGQWCDETTHLGLNIPNLSLSTHCPIVGLCVSSHILKRKLLRWWLCEALAYGYSRMLLGVVSLLWSFSKTLLGFTLSPCPIQSQVLGKLSSVRVPLHGAGFKSNQKSDPAGRTLL